MTKPVPHVHAELIKKWADGAQIQYKNYHGEWTDIRTPNWEPFNEYRVKPKDKIKKYKFAFENETTGHCGVTADYYKDTQEFLDRFHYTKWKFLVRLDPTMIEVDDDEE